MTEKAKYPDQDLTEEDKKILDEISYKYLAAYYNLTQKYSSPMEYAREEILKPIQSKKNVAILHAIAYAKNSPHGHLFRPGEINETLANQTRNFLPQNYAKIGIQLKEDEQDSKRFLHPRDLREKVLEELERLGIFIHLDGKEEIRRHESQPRHPGRTPSSDEIGNNRGGKPSRYIVSEDVEKLKTALEKPNALKYLRDKMARSDLAYRLAKFHFTGFLYAAKMDVRVIPELIGIGRFFYKGSLTREGHDEFKTELLELPKVSDKELEQRAAEIAKSATEDHEYYSFLFMPGLLKV
jgi:hypothetical protein